MIGNMGYGRMRIETFESQGGAKRGQEGPRGTNKGHEERPSVAKGSPRAPRMSTKSTPRAPKGPLLKIHRNNYEKYDSFEFYTLFSLKLRNCRSELSGFKS